MPRGVNKYDEARLQGRLWTPTLSRPALWFDAADASTITVSTGISEWRDKSGNGRHISQSTSSFRPIYSQTVLNSLPVVVFDGSNDYLTTTSFPTSFTELYIYIITKWQTTGTTVSTIQTIIDNNHTTSPLRGFVLQDRPDLTNRPLTFGHLPNLTAGANDNTTTGNNTWRIIGAEASSGVSDSFYRDGELIQTTTNTGAFNIQAQLNIGAWNNGGFVRYFNGQIAEILIMTNSQSRRVRQLHEGYLAWKWGLVSNLPASHPFKNRPPVIGD
jgi:hypothetical protein